jgi:hypothetical protein
VSGAHADLPLKGFAILVVHRLGSKRGGIRADYLPDKIDLVPQLLKLMDGNISGWAVHVSGVSMMHSACAGAPAGQAAVWAAIGLRLSRVGVLSSLMRSAH